MKTSDSKFPFPTIACVLLLCGCNAATTSHGATYRELDLSLATSQEVRSERPELAEFSRICLSGAHLPDKAKEIALSAGWTETDDGRINSAGLERLRKSILRIPGGGGRFTEEQEILAIETLSEDGKANSATLNLERRIAGDETRSTTCAIYGRTEFLKTCEQLGKIIGKAPDRNQVYPEREAHFIQWETGIDGKAATVSCSRTPQSAILPYDGTILSVQIDHSGTAQKTAFRTAKVRSSQPAFADSGR